MATHPWIDRIGCIVLAVTIGITVLCMSADGYGILAAARTMGYENRLFNTDSVHTVDIVMEDWDGFLSTCASEEYTNCAVIIDGEAYKNVGIRAKGNTSLSQVQSYGNNRYSFKIEFDHYETGKSYYGLDKICLNNMIQDNTYMKDYLSHQMMAFSGAAAPLCSFVYITVNGEDWGLYLAVEGVEEAFLERNYGSDYGELYKPESENRNGEKGEMEQPEIDMQKPGQENGGNMPTPPGQGENGNMGTPPEQGKDGDWMMPSNQGMVMGDSDVSLIYSDDEYSSYANIFDQAKTDVTDEDKDRLIASLKALNTGSPEEAVDIDAVIRYFVVHNFVCNFDSYTGSMIHNYYLYEKDGRLSMLPWDYNLAFGGFQGAQDATALVNYPIDTPVSGGTLSSRPMLAWIFSKEEYTEQYHQHFSEFIAKYFTDGVFEKTMDQVRELIAPYVEKDPTKFCTYEEFEQGIATLKEFCLLRAESVRGQLDGTIASTAEGQNGNRENWIDASSVNIEDMGTMNHGGGNPGQFGGMGFESNPNREEGGREPVSGSVAASEKGSGTMLWLALCTAVLIGGLAIAFFYRKRG